MPPISLPRQPEKRDVDADRRAPAPAGGADATDLGLAEGLAPLLDGRFGTDARELMLRCLSRRLTAGWSMNTAPLLALADATHIARATQEGAR